MTPFRRPSSKAAIEPSKITFSANSAAVPASMTARRVRSLRSARVALTVSSRPADGSARLDAVQGRAPLLEGQMLPRWRSPWIPERLGWGRHVIAVDRPEDQAASCRWCSVERRCRVSVWPRQNTDPQRYSFKPGLDRPMDPLDGRTTRGSSPAGTPEIADRLRGMSAKRRSTRVQLPQVLRQWLGPSPLYDPMPVYP